jgi:hypothetical protein
MTRRVLVMGAMVMTAVASSAFAAGMHVAQARDTRVYELRTYTTNPGKLPALEKRFAEHTLKLFEKHGMRNEMYWVPTDSALRDNTLIYVISHESREAADRNWKAFAADTTWQRVRAASEVDGTILAKAPERVYMRLTPYSPASKAQR